MLKNILLNQRQFIRDVIDRNYLWLSILIGFMGFYSLNLTSFFYRFIAKTQLENEAHRLFIEAPRNSVLYMICSTVIIYLVCLLFKGRKPIKHLIIAQGFGGLYIIIISIYMSLIPIITLHGKENGDLKKWMVMVILFVVFSGFALLFNSIRYSITAISEVYGFRISKSILIWIFTSLPAFIIYNSLTKLN